MRTTRDLERALVALSILLASLAVALAAGAADSSQAKSSGGNQVRQAAGSTAASLMGAVGAISSLVPALVSNIAPLVLLVGLGALMMPALSMSAMGLLREARRSSEQTLPSMQLPAAFAHYARPLQTSPQDIYYFTKRSFPSLLSNLNGAGLARGLQDLAERVAKAIDNADKRYN